MSSARECESTSTRSGETRPVSSRRTLPRVCAAFAAVAPAVVIFAGQARALTFPPPSGLHATGEWDHSFQVRWQPVSGASGYGIRVFGDGILIDQFKAVHDLANVGGLQSGTAYQVFTRTNGAGDPASITVLTRRPLSFGQKVAAFARSLVGDPYVYGADGPDAFDCSGLAKYVYQRYGQYLPRTADDQYHYVRHVDDPRPGDLVFFLSGGVAYHVGIYEGSDTMVSAATPAQGVVSQRLWTNAVIYGALRPVTGGPSGADGP
jgi:hypothetical protein